MLAKLQELRTDEVEQGFRERLARAGTSTSELLLHLPALLQALLDSLHGEPTAATLDYRDGFELTGVIAELRLLRDLLLEHTEPQHEPGVLRRLDDFVLAVMADAAREHAERAATHQRDSSLLQEEAALAQAEAERQKLYDLFMQAPAAICMTEGPSHIYIFANTAYRDVVGGRELLGKPFFGALPEMAGQGYDEKLDRVYQTGTSEFEAARPVTLLIEGQMLTRWFNVAITPKRNAAGEIDGVMRCVFDVSEQVLAQQRADRFLAELQRERAKLHGLFMQSPVAIAILEGAEHVFTFANPAYRALINGREVVDKPLREALPDVAGMGFDTLLDQVMRTGEPYHSKETPIRLAHHTGDEMLLLNFVYMPKFDAAGVADGVLMTGWDVTELAEARIRSEDLAAAVRASEAELRLVIDAIPLLISFVTVEERYRLVNRAYEEWFGHARETVIGKTLLEVIGAAAYAVLSPYVKRGLAGERFTFEQYGVPYRLGGTRDVRVTFIPHHDLEGLVDGYVALLEDISERRLFEQERERFALQRTEVLEAMGDAFFALDSAWRVVLVNQIFERVSQRPRSALLGRVYWELFPDAAQPDSLAVQSYRRCMQDRTAEHFVDHDAVRDAFTDVRVYPNADGGIAVFFRDVTAERRAQEALRRQAEFEQQLIGIVSHDLRNPLNVILLAAGRLARMEELGASASKNSVRIQNAAERAARMVSDLLDFTQARLGGGIRIEPRPTDWHELLSSVIDEVEAAEPGRELELTHSGEGQGEWDHDRLVQVVQNLLTNALKYSPPDSKVSVVSAVHEDHVSLLVQNYGRPIPADKLATLFEPFQRAVAQVDKVSRSVGLGLYIVRQVVEAHEGSVTVESTAQHGTIFRVRLPRKLTLRSGVSVT
jgi:sigma-B regulation protein RsbU (phosphoserine phosphatase)